MRINTRPVQFTLDGTPTKFVVSVVGHAPHRTYYLEVPVGFVERSEQAPLLVGGFISHECQSNGLPVPQIPGVTTEGEWKNPPFLRDEPPAASSERRSGRPALIGRVRP